MELSITLENPEKRNVLFGPADRHLKMIREALGVQIFAREEYIKVTGSSDGVARAAAVVEQLQKAIRQNRHIDAQAVSVVLDAGRPIEEPSGEDPLDVYVAGQIIKAKTPGQVRYIETMQTCDMVFCTGPAGTGKTYLAVAVAVHLLKHQRSKRLILVRPAVEAGEKLGFLPGDMQAKVNPYLRPLYDALHDMLEFGQIRRYLENDLIEVI
ncbi:MAG: PhoH family protein, partial [Planctomycetaceae bacterium]